MCEFALCALFQARNMKLNTPEIKVPKRKLYPFMITYLLIWLTCCWRFLISKFETCKTAFSLDIIPDFYNDFKNFTSNEII